MLVSKAYFAADSNLTKLTVTKIRLRIKKGATLVSCSFVYFYLLCSLIARLPPKKGKENGLTQKPTKKGGYLNSDTLPAEVILGTFSISPGELAEKMRTRIPDS